MIDIENITPEKISSLKVQYKLGIEHMKYFHDTMKHFKYPEKRLKGVDTRFYEKNLPEIEEALKKLNLI